LQYASNKRKIDSEAIKAQLQEQYEELKQQLDADCLNTLENWEETKKNYNDEYFTFKVRDKEIKIKNYSESLSHQQISKVSLPKYRSWGDLLKWKLQENTPGNFPFTAGIYPFKREGEDPTRMLPVKVDLKEPTNAFIM